MLILSAAVGFSQATALKKYPGQIKVLFHDGFAITAQTAQTYEEHEKGLMFRKSLAFDAGMLFVFEREENRVFWMKNTLINLDIIYIGKDMRINRIFHKVQASAPEALDSQVQRVQGSGMYVVEVPAGFSRRHNLWPGQKIRISANKSK